MPEKTIEVLNIKTPKMLGRSGYASELCGIIRIATTESVTSQARYCISWILLKSKLEVDRPHYGGHKITNNRNLRPTLRIPAQILSAQPHTIIPTSEWTPCSCCTGESRNHYGRISKL